MSTHAVSRCGQCRAMVNVRWPACLVCHASLEGGPFERGAASLPTSDWLGQWRDLAQVSMGLSDTDPRYDPILTALAACDRTYRSGDREQFSTQADHVMRIATFVPGSVVQWRGHDKKLHGPATITEVIAEDGRLWVCVKWKGQLYWVCELIIESIQEGKAKPRAGVRTL